MSYLEDKSIHYEIENQTEELTDATITEATIEERSQRFREDVTELIQDRGGDFLRDVAKKCERWNRCYEPIDVIADAYEIGQRTLYKGKEIPNTEAWLRVTIWNLLRSKKRELVRDQKNLVSLSAKKKSSEPGEGLSLEEQIKAPPDPQNPYYAAEIREINNELTNRIEAIKLGLKKLSPFQQRLVKAKHIEGKTWEEIKAIEGFQGKPTTLRQQGSRAMAKLKKILSEEGGEEN